MEKPNLNFDPAKQQYNHPDYTLEEIKQKQEITARIVKGRNDNERNYEELDDMDKFQYYFSNARAAHSYNKPRINEEDTRVVSGITQEKTITMLSAMLNYQFGINVMVYDKDDLPLYKLAKDLEDLEKYSREQEDYELKRPLLYKELLDQGTVYVQDFFKNYNYINRTVTGGGGEMGKNIKSTNVKSKMEKLPGKCEFDVLEGYRVYLGNMREFYIQNQPYVFTLQTIPYSVAAQIFGDWDRWKYVPDRVKKIVWDDHSSYRNWSEQETEENFVEVLMYMDKPNNVCQIVLNSIFMLPANYPLTEISPSGDYPIAKGDLEPISRWFSLSKSIGSKTKILQRVYDELLRLSVLKTQQSFNPPFANNARRDLGREIFYPGRSTFGIDANRITPLLNPTGVTAGEANFFNTIKGIIDENSTSPTFSGQPAQGDPTATEIKEMQRQQMMKMGISILGVANLEKQMAWLRIYNIIKYYTEPVATNVTKVKGKLKETKVYRILTMESTDDEGKAITKVVDFNDPEDKTDEQIDAEREMYEMKYEKPVELVYIDPEMLRSLKLQFYITVTPTDRMTSDLKKILFTKTLTDAVTLFGPQSVNMDYAREQFATLNDLDPEKFFVRQDQMMQGMLGQQEQMPMGAPQQGAQQGNQMMSDQIAKQIQQTVPTEKMPISVGR